MQQPSEPEYSLLKEPDRMPSLAAYVDSLCAEWNTPDAPGCALAVIHEGQVILTRVYGLADVEHGAPMTPTTMFHIASTSKQFTAMCIVLLIAQGKVALDDDIRRYVPELPAYEQPIMIGHLIYHTSGIRECLTLWALTGRDMAHCGPEAEVLALLARQRRLNFSPGAYYEYSNSNYFLLALIVQRASGTPLTAFATHSIFQPLAMRSTVFADDPTAITGQRAYGYIRTADGYTRAPQGIGLFGAAGVFTTLSDLVRWDQNFYHHTVGGADGIKQILTPGRLNSGAPIHYAFGLYVQDYRGTRIVSHAGAFPGIATQLLRFPERRFSVICLCNLETINPSMLGFQIADHYLGQHLRRPHEQPVSRSAQSALDLHRYTGAFRDIRSGSICDLAVQNDQLIVQMMDHSFPITPVSATHFAVAGAIDRTSVTFEPPHDAVPLRMHLTIEGEESTTFEAVQRVIPTAAEVDAFAGNYYSEELQLTYQFARLAAQLIFCGLNIPLEPTIQDGFRGGYGMYFEFFRDNQGIVAGFSLSTYHANHLRFKRIIAAATAQ
jgi:CubicO group peptidase (beta-lactamase class C family)